MEVLFKEHGKKIEAPANFRLSLQKKGTIWFLEKGALILFAVQKKEGHEGRRTLLSTVQSGRLLFDMERKGNIPFEIFAFSEEPVIIWEMEVEDFKGKLKNSPSNQEAFSPLLEHYLNQFGHFVFSPIEISPKHWIHKGGIGVEKGETFTIKISEVPVEKERVVWLTPKGGDYKLLGSHEVKFSQNNFPLLPHLYFLSLEKIMLQSKSTPEVIHSEVWQEGLTHFHHFIGNYLVYKRAFLDQEELKRFEEKEKLQEETLHETLSEMVGVLKTSEDEEIVTSTDPLIQSAEIVFRKQGIKFTAPEKNLGGELKDKVERIAEGSEARMRGVQLGSLWWKFDSGPLLTFYGKERHPIALYLNQWGKYEMIDPVKGKKKKITEKIARNIALDAYSFYKAIPDEIHNGKEALLFYFKESKMEFIKLLGYGLIAAIFSLFPPIGISFIFNSAIPNANADLLIQITLGMIAAAASAALFIYFRSLILGRIDGKLSSSLQPAIWDRLLKLPANFFRCFTAGDLLQRSMAMEQMRPLLSSNISQAILTGIFALLYLIIMTIYSPRLTALGVSLLVVAVFLTVLLARWKIRVQGKVYEMQGKINGALVQILSGVAKLRVAGAENNAFSYWAKQFSKSKSIEMFAQNIQNIVTTSMAAFPHLSIILIFGAVMRMEEMRSLSIGNFLAFNTAYMTLSMAVFSMSNIVMQAAAIVPLWRRSYVIIEEPQELLIKKSNPGKLTGDIRLDHITFSYEKEGVSILNDVSICLAPREMIGIVGPSGGGKSTLIRIILGFETPRSGAIYFNGKDLSHLNLSEVRRQMGVVLQGGGIIAGTLYQNIVAGGQYTEEEIDRAISLASFKNDLENFPMGLHTVVPMNGETLSGGQKQRLLITRALLPNPKILLLDEATSALDNNSQEEITQNIDQLDISRIVIAHRLSTIKNADRIYVLEKGEVTQTGSFKSLSNESGLFAEMLKRQKL